MCFTFEKVATSNRNLIEDAETIIELSKDAYSLYLRQSQKEKAELMKLLTIELLFDGQNLIITPYSAFSNLIKLSKSHKLEDLVHPAIFSCRIPDAPVFTGLFLNFSGIQCDYYNNKPCVCKVLYPKFPKQPNRELAGN